ncbi:hypothetical protein NQ318_008412 [Aromia moschata]|uniref:Carboxylesterase type B domain-containing protein n=1 Tax=Aromia moschata TaxID=1265417 RepID=A0AAV8X503_9CUCU|nr:hypothetical protein NQ318_008412 [Aromia moschata]
MGETGDEDCLYLNVYVPTDSMDHQKKFDVVVIIHGGAFMIGSGHLAQSEFLVDRDLIFVTFNYRLGALGFLSTEDEVIPGNYGMKDQVLALKWVRENIASFGGLFVRGISQSGTALDPWAIRRHPLERARKLAILLGCSDESTQELKKCLKQKPARLILEKQGHFYGIGQSTDLAECHFLLRTRGREEIRESVFGRRTALSPQRAQGPRRALDLFYSEVDKVNDVWPQIAPFMLDYNYTLPESKREEVAKQIFTDRLFAIGSDTAAKLQSKTNKSPVYYYYFNYQKGENKALKFYAPNEQELEGVAHGEDMFYFYGFNGLKKFSEGDTKLKNACQDMLYSYATKGIPSVDGTDKWIPTKYSELTYLNITDADDIKLQTVDSLAPTEFWRDIGLLEYELYSDEKDTKDEL